MPGAVKQPRAVGVPEAKCFMFQLDRVDLRDRV